MGCSCHCFGHLSIEQKSVIGERLVLVTAQLQESCPFSQTIILVAGIRPQLFILCGLERDDVSELTSPSHIVIVLGHYAQVLLYCAHITNFERINTHHSEGSAQKRRTCCSMGEDV